MKKKILLVGIILSIFSSALTGCKVFNKNEDNTNKNGNSSSQNSYEIYNNPKKSYSIMETTDTISYKNDDTIVILEEDGDLYQIKNELNKMITKEDISEFTSVIKIENGKIVLKMTGAKAYGLKKNVIEHTITAIKYPVSLYVNPQLAPLLLKKVLNLLGEILPSIEGISITVDLFFTTYLVKALLFISLSLTILYPSKYAIEKETL